MTNTGNTDIRPFRVEIPETDLTDLRERLARTRRPHVVAGTETDWSRGIAPSDLAALTDYWQHEYDWRAQEAKLNSFPQFLTEIDGQTIHFFHVRSPEPNAVPLLLTHGYPSSVAEFVDMMGPLTDPRAHGGDPADAFHVVVPSLPGFGFSTPLASTGWEVARTTDAFAELMTRLGYEKFGAHGGDIGSGITGRLGALFPDRLIGTHINSDSESLGLAGEQFPVPDYLNEDELEVVHAAQAKWSQRKGYLVLQSTQPNALASALTDSPVGQLAWIAEKLVDSTGNRADRDKLLTIASIYWFTQSGASAAQFLWEAEHSGLDWIAPSDVPAGWAVFDASPVLRRIMDPDKHMTHYSEYVEGGHYAALEVPELLVDDVRAFFRTLRG